MPITASSLALILVTALTPQAQQRDRDVVRVPGFNAIAGQQDVELLLWIDADIARALSASAIETASMAQLRRAGLNVTKWVSFESRKPALRVSIHGALTREDELLYYVSIEYFVVLRVSLSKPVRAKKVEVFNDGTFGVVSISRAAQKVTDAVAACIGRFVQNGYSRANHSAPAAPAMWNPADFIVDVKEAMKGYPMPLQTNVVVAIDAEAPVSKPDVEAVVFKTLKKNGLGGNVGSYFMSIYPQIAVNIDAAQGTRGRLMYTVRAEYRRNVDIPPEPNRIRFVLAGILSSEGVGLGAADFAITDILKSVAEHVTEVVKPHVEANGVR
jgi:hypothetical protein